MRRLTIVFLLLLLVIPTIAQGGTFGLTIFHTDNVHDENEADEGIGGAAKQATVLNETRATTDHVLFLMLATTSSTRRITKATRKS